MLCLQCRRSVLDQSPLRQLYRLHNGLKSHSRSYAQRKPLPPAVKKPQLSPVPYKPRAGSYSRRRRGAGAAPEEEQFTVLGLFKKLLLRSFSSKRLFWGFIGSVASFSFYQFIMWHTDPLKNPIIATRHFSPFLLEARNPLTPESTASVLNLLSVPAGRPAENVEAAWRTGIWSVQVMQPDMQVARNYTPLPPIVPSADDTEQKTPPEMIRLFVRALPPQIAGEVSKMLLTAAPGTVMHLRGPFLQYAIPDDLDEIVFVAGGTGIAPAMQVAHCLYQARPSQETSSDAPALTKMPNMRILWANRTRDESKKAANLEGEAREGELVQRWRKELWTRIRGDTAPSLTEKATDMKAGAEVEQTQIVRQLEDIAQQAKGKLSVEYFVDEDKTFINEANLKAALIDAGGISARPASTSQNPPQQNGASDQPSRNATQSSKKLIIVSGSDGFVSYVAGPKVWSGGREMPGPLGGLLGAIKPNNWEIWTL